jgi:hypothetical protein
MNKPIPSAIMLAILSATAVGQVPADCPATVTVRDVIAAMGEDVRVQPVFSPEGIKGWRIYWGGEIEALRNQAIPVGSMMTHICGVIARDVEANGQSATCKAAKACEIDVTFRMNDGQERKAVFRRKATKAPA